MGKERRQHDRKKVDLDCEIEIEATGARGPAHISQMSVGGCFVETSDLRTYGSTVCLRFAIGAPLTDMALNGIVRWTSDRGMGVQFLALGVSEVYTIAQFLVGKGPASLPPPDASTEERRARRQAAIDRADLKKRWLRLRQRDRRFAQAKKEAAAPADDATPAPPSAPSSPGDSSGNKDRLTTRVMELELEVASLSKALAKRDDQLAGVKTMLEEREGQVQSLRQALHERDEQLQEAQRPPDDFTRIPGIGPKFAVALRAAGLRRWSQIAALTEADIDTLAEQLGTSARRIRNARWIENAARLAAGDDPA